MAEFHGSGDNLGTRVVRRVHPLWVGRSEDLVERSYRRLEVQYRGERGSVVVFRHAGVCRGYRNLCVHMPRELDCETDTIFAPSGQRLRCSMHGIVYDPVEGASVSTMCHGERLTAVNVEENERGVWIVDKRVRPL